jgi:hypothetical protein
MKVEILATKDLLWLIDNKKYREYMGFFWELGRGSPFFMIRKVALYSNNNCGVVYKINNEDNLKNVTLSPFNLFANMYKNKPWVHVNLSKTVVSTLWEKSV